MAARPAVTGLELVHGLQEQRDPDLAAARDGEQVVDVADVEVREVVEKEPYGDGHAAARAAVRLAQERLEGLVDEEARERVERAVDVAHGREERAALVAEAGEVDLAGGGVESERAVEPQAHELFGDDADDARVHLLGIARGGVAPIHRGREAVGSLTSRSSSRRNVAPSLRCSASSMSAANVCSSRGSSSITYAMSAARRFAAARSQNGSFPFSMGQSATAMERMSCWLGLPSTRYLRVRERVVAHVRGAAGSGAGSSQMLAKSRHSTVYPALASVAPISRQSVPLVSSTMKLGPIWSRLGLSTWRVLPRPRGR